VKTFVIFRRELIGYFLSPLAWVVAIAFSLLLGLFFYFFGLKSTEATLAPVYNASVYAFILAFPALTMGSLAGEFRSGTFEVLATDPVRDVEIVAGKFLGVMAFFAVLLVPLPLYFVLYRVAGARPDAGPVVSGLVGMLLTGALCASIGLFASSLTSNQTVAFVMGFLALLVLRLIGTEVLELPEAVSRVLAYMSMPRHLSGLLRGRISSEDVIYFVSTTALFLFLSTRVLEARRWA
jgi:gliding motility-associated transport system permease protein